MNVYLINTTSNAIVGRFESVTDAEIAGELLLGTDGYYVGDREDLAKWKMTELFRLAQSVGETAPNWNFKAKTWGIDRLVELADAYDFAPPAPSKPEPAPKAKRAPKTPRTPKDTTVILTGKGTILRKRPTQGDSARVWAICDEMCPAGATRKEVLARCKEEGIGDKTAAQNYGRWHNKE